MFNEKGQSPCDMAGYLYSVCKDDRGSNIRVQSHSLMFVFSLAITVPPLEPGNYYVGPDNSTYATLCACSTVTWSLFCACATCQNGITAMYVDELYRLDKNRFDRSTDGAYGTSTAQPSWK